ncbi:hypothetical protein N7495_005687 [Penicillium taxi]|uniref:uncharacterized protein n=1 Tax=Penicillium taxi TaxID=168475 RepID=UPI0025457BB1|nr:uncharacterized protein N7495_005687 [Penicillium taxi]KAJ5893996.1 hypothetical protein N7495_005687 [Penicillium taxi]
MQLVRPAGRTLMRPLVSRLPSLYSFQAQQCWLHYDGRNRVSNFWIPTGGISKKPVDGEKEDANDLLIRGGFLRQAYSGVFHLLPLGLRVQDKLERLIDKHMRTLGASKVSLSSISSQELWEQSGRLTAQGSEVFRFNDRKDARFLLAPTHEEEITTLVGGLTTSYKSLPLRVYQISRKYRDEARPRQGLLRGREFIMKDLYTFDYSAKEALKTYLSVKHAYTQLFDELKIPYLVAAADSGNMGGSLSHEFHFVSSKGEDYVVSCSNCDHVYNEELADGKAHSSDEASDRTADQFQTKDSDAEAGSTISNGMWTAISHDGSTLLRVWYPKYSMQGDSTEPVERLVNSHAVKAITSAAGVDLDLSVENPQDKWTTYVKGHTTSTPKPRVLDLYDSRVRVYQRPPLSDLLQEVGCSANDIDYSMLDRFPGTENKLSLVRVHSGDQCFKCSVGHLESNPTVELGHTFHLGTRYSKVLNASVSVNPAVLEESEFSASKPGKEVIVPIQMGCHGIGVSRMISAVANNMIDSKGLNWPRAMAPYEVAVVPAKGMDSVAEQVYDTLTSTAKPVDVLLDDRDKGMGWKLSDADLIGYPVIVVVGNGWKKSQTLEVQCRQLNVKDDITVRDNKSSISLYVRASLSAQFPRTRQFLSSPTSPPALRPARDDSPFCQGGQYSQSKTHNGSATTIRLRWSSSGLKYVSLPENTPQSRGCYQLASAPQIQAGPANNANSIVSFPEVNLASLSLPQLRSLQTRLTSELEHLTTSHTKLRGALNKFRDCVRTINDGVVGSEKKGTAGQDEILVPLTSSLYVKGRLADREKVLVDVGTGFYVEKTPAKAAEFYEDKAKGLESNLQEVEKIVQGKSSQLRVTEEVLRQKMLSGEAVPSESAAASAS